MALTITIDNVYDLRREFANYDREYYTEDAYEFMLDFYDGTELDVIGICCELSEYDEEEFCRQYGYKYPLEDFKDEYNIEGILLDTEKELYIEELIKEVEMNATCVLLNNGNILVAE